MHERSTANIDGRRVGRPSREEENVSVGNRKCSFPKPSSHDNIIEELNLMT
jgi:hypothetical protein